MLVDDSAGATVRQLGDGLTDIEVNGHFFGSASLTVALQSNTASVASVSNRPFQSLRLDSVSVAKTRAALTR
jgi:hypothetical protein